ncbi:MAG: hypothetical protein RSE93_06690, partial [Oscillospiraceae bacterium]
MDKNISVEDILKEIEIAKQQVDTQGGTPKSDMKAVDDIILQILTEKKNKELQQNEIELDSKLKQEMEKELKVKTKSLAKEYEKYIKNETKQLKKEEKEHEDAQRKIDEVLGNTDFDFIKKNLEKEVSKEITINKVIPNQSVKLNDTVQNI